MAEGFQTFGDDGRLVFDSSTMMFGMVGKGSGPQTVSTVSPNPDRYPGIISLTNLPTYQFAVLACSAPFRPQVAYDGGPTNVLNVTVFAVNGAQVQLSYWLFARYAALPDSSAGLIAYNANGQKCLDLGYPPLRVIEATPITMPNNSTTNTRIYVPNTSGRTLGYLRYGTVERRTGELMFTEPNSYRRELPAIATTVDGFRFVPITALTQGTRVDNISNGGIITCDMTNL